MEGLGKQFIVIPPSIMRERNVGDLIRSYETKGHSIVSFQVFKQGNLASQSSFNFYQEIPLRDDGPLLVLGLSDGGT